MSLVSAASLGSLKSLVVLFIISNSSPSTVGLGKKALLVNGGYVDLQEKDHFKIKDKQITLEAWIYQEKPCMVRDFFLCLG